MSREVCLLVFRVVTNPASSRRPCGEGAAVGGGGGVGGVWGCLGGGGAGRGGVTARRIHPKAEGRRGSPTRFPPSPEGGAGVPGRWRWRGCGGCRPRAPGCGGGRRRCGRRARPAAPPAPPSPAAPPAPAAAPPDPRGPTAGPRGGGGGGCCLIRRVGVGVSVTCRVGGGGPRCIVAPRLQVTDPTPQGARGNPGGKTPQGCAPPPHPSQSLPSREGKDWDGGWSGGTVGGWSTGWSRGGGVPGVSGPRGGGRANY